MRIEKFICADDVGKAINPQQVVGQIEGAVVQALGYTLLEDWKTRDGRVLTDRLSTYLIPTVLDVPDQLESIIVEVPDPNGPWGARGMGEVPYLPVAAAVAAAVYDAVGVRFDEFPLTPERVWRGCAARSNTRANRPFANGHPSADPGRSALKNLRGSTRYLEGSFSYQGCRLQQFKRARCISSKPGRPTRRRWFFFTAAAWAAGPGSPKSTACPTIICSSPTCPARAKA